MIDSPETAARSPRRRREDKLVCREKHPDLVRRDAQRQRDVTRRERADRKTFHLRVCDELIVTSSRDVFVDPIADWHVVTDVEPEEPQPIRDFVTQAWHGVLRWVL